MRLSLTRTGTDKRYGQLWIIVVVIAAILYPLLDAFLIKSFNTTMLPILIPSLLFTLLALGLNIVVGYAGLLDLGYAAFFAIGAYTIGILSAPQSPIARWLASEGVVLPFWILLLLGGPIAAFFGMLLGAPTLRLRGDYLAIVTLGFGEIVPVFFRNIPDITNGIQGMNPIPRPTINLTPIGIPFHIGFESNDLASWYYLAIVIMGLSIIAMLRLRSSRLGRAWLAIREDELAAASMGIDPVRTKLLAFALGASFSGFAGAFWASYLQLVSPDMFQFGTSVLVLSMIILGGIGNVWGVLLGGMVIMMVDRFLLPNLTGAVQGFGKTANLPTLATADFSNARWMLFGASLVIMMLVRPQGLLPEARIGALMKRNDEKMVRQEDTSVREVRTADASADVTVER